MHRLSFRRGAPGSRARSAIFLLACAVLLAGARAVAYPGNITCSSETGGSAVDCSGNPTSAGFITWSQFFSSNTDGTVTDPNYGTVAGCAGCHSPASNPYTASVTTGLRIGTSGAFTTLATSTSKPVTPFTVTAGQPVTFNLQASSASFARAGFLVYHNDGSSGDANGALGAGDSHSATCKQSNSDPQAASGPTTCYPTQNDNTEVMHMSPQPLPAVYSFTWNAPNTCQTYQFVVNVNYVNADFQCFNNSDVPEFYLFSVTTSCDDGKSCTTNSCPAGTCVYTPNNAACDDGKPCTDNVCNPSAGGADPATGCVFPADNNNTCSDGKTCTSDNCSGGNCVGTPIGGFCNDGKPCTDDACNPSAGGADPTTGCVFTADNGNTCSDGKTCTTDSCSGGNCVSTPKASFCNDGLPCTDDSCNPSAGGADPTTGCIFTNDNSNACTDGVGCTADSCVSGACVSTDVNSNCDDANSCTTDTCSPGSPGADSSTGCLYGNIADGTGCNWDGQTCHKSTCSGGKCNQPNTGVSCRAGSCSQPGAGDAVAINPAVCTSAGACPSQTTTDCGGQPCNLTDTACQGSCAVDTDCQKGFFCNSAHNCQGQVGQGTGCAADDMCSTGFCTDGVCCNSRCGGNVTSDCQACNAAGTCTTLSGTTCDDGDACTTKDTCSNGTCAGAAQSCDDKNPCTVDACDKVMGCTNTPGNAGTECRGPAGPCDIPEACDGSHAGCPADKFMNGSPCGNAMCTGGQATAAATCGGSSAACPAGSVKTCAPYACGSAACLTKCGADTDCSKGNYCASGGKCAAQGKPGDSCSAPNQCASNFCVDGVCCDGDCSDQCEACNVAGHPGTCTPVNGPPVGARPACPGDGSACNGTCNGTVTKACTFSSTTQCRAPSCANGTATASALCDGSGSCPGLKTVSCGDQVCGPTACQGCTTDRQCGSGKYCLAGVCKAVGGKGAACDADRECGTANCVDGVCCDSDCSGQCEACNLPNTAGSCTAVTGAPVSPRPACNADHTACDGACDGKNGNACTYPGAGVPCRAADCQNGRASLAAYCNGSGKCPLLEEQDCPSGSICQGTECGGASACTTDGDCGTGFCSGGVCVKKKENGTPCGSATECTSSFCVDNFCCDAICSGQCQACDVTGQEGVCQAVIGAPHGARQACATDGSSCGGQCDGSTPDRCAYGSASQSCRPASCRNDVATLAGHCQSNGSCGPLEGQDCGAFGCDSKNVQCAGDCKADGDCTSGQFCSAGICTAKFGDGSVCGATDECSSGNCVDGVCCDKPCTGECQSCDQANSLGTCAPVAGAPRDGRPACAGVGPCGGACDGVSGTACAFPDSNTACGVVFCDNGYLTGAASCEGNATCLIPFPPTPCYPYVCDPSGTSCLATCALDTDCQTGTLCENGACLPPIFDAGPDATPDSGTGGASGGGGAPLRDAGAGHRDGAVATGGNAGSTGATSSMDGGHAGGSAHSDAGKAPSRAKDSGGCGCRVPAHRTGDAPALGALALIGLLVKRRSRSGRDQRNSQR